MSRLNDIIYDALSGAEPFADGHVARADTVEEALLKATGGPDHVINVKGVAWTVQHPLSERFEEGHENLFSCRFTQAAAAIAEGIQASDGDGKYRVWLDRQAFQWEALS